MVMFVCDCSALLLNSIMSAFAPQFIANRAIFFSEMIKECEDTGFPKVIDLYCTNLLAVLLRAVYDSLHHQSCYVSVTI